MTDTFTRAKPEWQDLSPVDASPGEPVRNLADSAPSSDAPARVEIVFPPDTRQRVDPTTQFPWNAQGELIMDFPNGETYSGTGTLIDQSYVLTAAHNLFSKDIGGWAKSVWFLPARNGNDLPYGTFQAASIFVNEEYQSLSPPDPNANEQGNVKDVTLYTEDYGLVKLKQRAKLPIYGMYAASDQELRNPMRITGYPGDKPAHTMWTDAGNLTNADDHFLYYRINTYRGESGAGVIGSIGLPVGDAIVGIHVAGDAALETNFAVRLDKEKIDHIRRWMNQGE